MARARTARGEGTEETPALAAIKTYRYLLLALVGLVVLLFSAHRDEHPDEDAADGGVQ